MMSCREKKQVQTELEKGDVGQVILFNSDIVIMNMLISLVYKKIEINGICYCV